MSLVIGAPGVGKTLLMKRLQTCSAKGSYADVGEPPSTISTVGTNLINVTLARKQEVTLRELGGCMAPIWHNYYNDCKSIIYVMDMSNRMQVSSSCIQLLQVLTHEQLQHSVILILLNKVDVPNAMNRSELESIFRLTDIIRCAKQQIAVVQTSARDGKGLEETMKWIQSNCA